MSLPPPVEKFLKAIGLNPTQIQWRLHERQQRKEAEEAARERGDLIERPANKRWMDYEHKICPSCKRIVPREDNVCEECGTKVPSYEVYKARRALGELIPENDRIVTGIFLTLCTIIFGVGLLKYGMSTLMRPTNESLLGVGAQLPPLVRYAHEYWRMMSAGLVHIGVLHFFMNMYAFMQLGPLTEAQIGSRKMFVMITFTQITTGIAVQFFAPHGITAGASGWLFGLLGFGTIYYHRAGHRYHHIRNQLAQYLAIGWVLTFLFGFSAPGHGGGMVGGMIFALIVNVTPQRKASDVIINWAVLPSIILWIWTLVMITRNLLE